jgi:hypothetical protein
MDAMSEIWDQAYELYADLEDLNDEELLSVRLNMKGRAKSIMKTVERYQSKWTET